jgi:hypothetical protein
MHKKKNLIIFILHQKGGFMTKAQKDKYLDYISKGILIISATVGAIYTCKAYGGEFLPNAQLEISHFNLEARLSPSDEYYYKNKRDHHLEQGNYYLQQAHDLCWYLPRISDRNLAKDAWTLAVSQFNFGSPQQRLCTALLTVMTAYGMECIDEWKNISTMLYTAEYHFEMYDFYKDILARA